MASDALISLAYFGGACYLAKIWLEDTRALAAGNAVKGALPGAAFASRSALAIGAVAGVLLCALATGVEYGLGVSEDQSDIAATFLLQMLAAAFIEEVIFRGYLVVPNKGKAVLWASCVGFSFLFAALHPFLWKLPEEAEFYEIWKASSNFTTQAWVSFGSIFLNSLVFYALRFAGNNPGRSLLPCVAAHATYNLSVFAVKLSTGHVTHWWELPAKASGSN